MKHIKLFEEFLNESVNEGVGVDEGLGSFFNRLKTAGGATLELSKAITAANKGDIQAVKEYMASAESKVPQEKRKELQKIFAKSVADATTNKKMSFLISKMYESVNEATTSWAKMMNAVKSSAKEHGRGTPWTLVAIDGRAVVGQKADIRTLEIIPAYYEEMRLQFPNAKIHIEDGTGAVVWSSK